MRRLLILCEFPTLLGGERSMLSTLSAVASAGYRTTIAAPPAGDMASLLHAEGVELLPLRFFDSEGRRLPQDRRREALAELIRSHRPDLVHSNSLAMSRLAGPVAAELEVPAIGHLRDIINLSRRAIDDLNCNRRLLAVSAATRSHHVERGLDADRTFVLHNGVDLTQFHPRRPTGYLHEELGIPAGSPLIINVGQICLRKAQNLVVEVAARLACSDRTSPSPHFLLIGSREGDKDETRELEQSLREVASTGPTAGSIHLLGTRGDVDRILGETAILLHTARQEPLGRVLLEASASGTPIVATDVGGTREILTDESGESTGLIVPKDDITAMTYAIKCLLQSPDQSDRLRKSARQRAEKAFDIRRAGPNLVAHYDEICN